MKTLRSPAVLVGLVALVVVLAATFFVRPLRRDAGEVPKDDMPGEGIPGAMGARLQDARASASGAPAPSQTAAVPAFRWEIIATLEQGGRSKLISKANAERFLQIKGVTALNLLAVAIATEDDEFTQRAAALFPDHPAVQLSVLAKNKDLPAAERAEWIERFKASAPDNPLPFLYAAQHAFEAKDPATALAVASEAIDKPGLYLWSSEFSDAGQQLYEFNGYSPLEAQLVSAFSHPLPHLGDLQKLGGELMKLREEAVKGNDITTADEALRSTYGLGRIFQSPEGSRTVINQLVGISLESRALKAVPVGTQPAFLGVPRAQREAEITRLKDFVRGTTASSSALMTRQDPVLLAGYLQRYRDEGWYQAMLWLKEQTQ